MNLIRIVICSLALSLAPAAEVRKEFKFTVSAGTTVQLINRRGDITVKHATGRQVTIVSTAQSDKVEVDARQSGSRVEIRTHSLQKVSGDEARVTYEIALPADVSLNIDSGEGAIRIENVRGNVNIDSDAGHVEVRGISGGSLSIQTVSGPITLAEIKQMRVHATSTGGNISLTNVTGENVTAKSTTGNIRYSGDFTGGGTYSFINHSGQIDVLLPANASVELAARSVKGTVENDFPFQKAAHPSFQPTEGKSLAGTSGSGTSSVELRSFSGKIRVTKQ